MTQNNEPLGGKPGPVYNSFLRALAKGWDQRRAWGFPRGGTAALGPTWLLSPLCPALSAALLGILYEDKERQDFIFTIYHWWQAVAIFTVYLGSSLPMKVRTLPT